MSEKLQVSTWINKAGSCATPLIHQVSLGIYKVYAPEVIVPATGEIFGRGEKIKYKGIEVTIPVAIPTWDLKDIAILRSIETGEVLDTVAPEPEPEPEPTPEPEPEPTPTEMKVWKDKSDWDDSKKVPATSDFEAMTKKELDEWASNAGIELDGRKSKKEMIETIENSIA